MRASSLPAGREGSDQLAQEHAKRGLDMEKIRIEQHSFVGSVWFVGWLFTLGLLHLSFWKGVLAIVMWPYYLGATCSALLPH
jgi:hypothetical protein